MTISLDLYAGWRTQNWAAQALAERPDGSPLTEQVLQLIWQHQRVRREDLVTTDGQPLRVLHPGFWNREAGPDFRNAIIQFGDRLACNGDVEVDLAPQGWHAHRHDQNPAYKHVILHVVWEADTGLQPLPTLALKPRLDASLEELSCWLRNEPQRPPSHLSGRCSAALRSLSEDDLNAILDQAAHIRLRSKADQMQARAKQVGWEQALWDGMFGALGYKNNVWPMRRISEVLPTLTRAQGQPASAMALQARLLGISGLLPADLPRAEPVASLYLQKIWNVWWREREQFADITLPRSMWRLNGLRPANHPQRRLALAAHWLARSDLPARLERWFATARPGRKLAGSLLEVLGTDLDDFWSCHWTFQSARISEPKPLIGPQRVTDLAINVILPWFWIRAVLGHNSELQQLAEDCYFTWPKAEDNAVLRLAMHRFFGTTKLSAIHSAARQQAVLQIVRDFCDYSNALCEHCQFPSRLATVVDCDKVTGVG